MRSLGLEVTQLRPRGQENFPGYVEDEFRQLYAKYHTTSMVPWSGLYAAYKAARYVIDANISGDIVECGVWKGGCSALMMETFKAAGQEDRIFHLYDTFEGMSEPTAVDVHFSGAQNALKQYKEKEKRGKKWSHGPLEEAKATIERSGYPQENIKIIQGDVIKTLPQNVPQSIALLRLDTDWYESTKAEMDHLYPVLQNGGVFLCDDYGAWKGSYDAVHEYFEEHAIKMLLNIDTSYGGATGVKP